MVYVSIGIDANVGLDELRHSRKTLLCYSYVSFYFVLCPHRGGGNQNSASIPHNTLYVPSGTHWGLEPKWTRGYVNVPLASLALGSGLWPPASGLWPGLPWPLASGLACLGLWPLASGLWPRLPWALAGCWLLPACLFFPKLRAKPPFCLLLGEPVLEKRRFCQKRPPLLALHGAKK